MSLKRRIENGTTTAGDAINYERQRAFASGILRSGAILIMIFLVLGFAAGVLFGISIP